MKQHRQIEKKNNSGKPRVNDRLTLVVDNKVYSGKVSAVTQHGVYVKPDGAAQIDAQPVFLPLFLLFGLRNGIGRLSGFGNHGGGFGGFGGSPGGMGMPGGFGHYGNGWMGQGFGGTPQRAPWGMPGQGNMFGGGGNMGGGNFGVGNMLRSLLW